MDWHPFAGLDHPGYDILVVWDYRELNFNWQPFFRYDEICLIAWSMGVFAASITIHEILPRVTMRVAVNGTLNPIDDRTGIPPAIWHGTHRMLSPVTWRKFQRRMCDSAEQYETFHDKAPRRAIDDLKEELEALETHTIFHVEQMSEWDLAVISRHDAIFPYDHQVSAWQDLAPIRVLDCGHLPDFSQLLGRLIIDKGRVERCFENAGATYAQKAVVQKEIADQLMRHFDKIAGGDDIVGNVIEIGPGADCFLTHKWYTRTDRRAKLQLWDLVKVDTSPFGPNLTFEQCDAEVRIKRQPSESTRFIFSSSTIQWFNSLRDFFQECSRVLVPGGYLVVSSFAHGNLRELSSVTGNGLQLPTPSDWRRNIPSDMEILLIETQDYTITFPTIRQVLEHFRDTGVNGVHYCQSPAVTALRLLKEYPQDAETGMYNVTFCPIFIIARKADPQS